MIAHLPRMSADTMRLNAHLFQHIAPPASAKRRTGKSWRAAWREIDGRRIFFRSRWEFNYGLYLELLRNNGDVLSWEHEPETFWFEKIRRGVRSYLPDYRVTLKSGAVEYHEVKGWMDAKSMTKLKRMEKYHPHITIRIIQADWFRSNSKTLRAMLPQWEHSA